MTLIDAPAVPSTPRHKDLQNLSASEIAARIAARELSSVAVVEHFVARLKAQGRQRQAQCRHRRSVGKRAQGR
jgi:Asp-tRNA(Asn)/Glu-tRNA(Gln) amidotransferase A subunit family amidase